MLLNLFDQSGQSTQDLTRESSEFLWYQLLREYIMKMVQTNDSKKIMLEKFRLYYRTIKAYLSKVDESKNLRWYELIDYQVGYLLIEMDQSVEAIRYSENLLEEAKDDKNSFIALFGLVIACLNNEQVEQANEYINHCCKLYENIPDGTIYDHCHIFDLLGSIAHKQNRPKLAIHYYTEILKIVPEDDTDMISIANTNLANIYYSNVYYGINEFDKAIDNCMISLTLIDDNNERKIAQIYENIFGCYGMMSEYLLAITYLEKSLVIQE
ncbi:unnamed protein product [Adineta steineri]|uniref:Tetratricopeptide repeat protein n=1 Tax=Adineta steineri TaxID=433720 RepID=A0A815M5K9_9BILA|nr:unnamed protein product [Adineta steineri]CAF1619084.1 unnamed protein product [Adineta steineri]